MNLYSLLVMVNIYFLDTSRKPSICWKRKWKKTLQYDLNMLVKKIYDSNVKVQRTIYSKTKCTHAMNTNIISNFLSSQSKNVKDWKTIQKQDRYIFFDLRENKYIVSPSYKLYILSKQLFGIIVSNNFFIYMCALKPVTYHTFWDMDSGGVRQNWDR